MINQNAFMQTIPASAFADGTVTRNAKLNPRDLADPKDVQRKAMNLVPIFDSARLTPLVVNKHNGNFEVLCGNIRSEMIRMLVEDRKIDPKFPVPCMVFTDLTESEARQLVNDHGGQSGLDDLGFLYSVVSDYIAFAKNVDGSWHRDKNGIISPREISDDQLLLRHRANLDKIGRITLTAREIYEAPRALHTSETVPENILRYVEMIARDVFETDLRERERYGDKYGKMDEKGASVCPIRPQLATVKTLLDEARLIDLKAKKADIQLLRVADNIWREARELSRKSLEDSREAIIKQKTGPFRPYRYAAIMILMGCKEVENEVKLIFGTGGSLAKLNRSDFYTGKGKLWDAFQTDCKNWMAKHSQPIPEVNRETCPLYYAFLREKGIFDLNVVEDIEAKEKFDEAAAEAANNPKPEPKNRKVIEQMLADAKNKFRAAKKLVDEANEENLADRMNAYNVILGILTALAWAMGEEKEMNYSGTPLKD